MTSEMDPVSAQSEKEEAGTEYTGYEEYGGEIEVEHEETELEGDEFTPLSSNDDPEKIRDYKEYRRLERDIKFQNQTLEKLKDQIQHLAGKPCLTQNEQDDLKNLNDNWEHELQKLRCLIFKATQLNNFGSRKHYREFPLITTFDEDNLNLKNRTCETLQEHASKSQPKLKHFRSSGGESSELDRSFSCNESQMSVSEERKLMKEIFAALKECRNLKECRPQKQKHHQSKENGSMEKLKNKINCMQQTICKLTQQLNKKEIKTNPCANCNHTPSNTMPSKPAIDSLMNCFCKKNKKADDFQQLKDNYVYLLTEFGKRDEKLKDLNQKLRTSCAKCCANGGDGVAQGDADESELILLRNRINEMNEEQVEFQCLMREQSLQLDDYRNKYLLAQQKVEEQGALMEKLNMNNKRIEKQINLEVKQIREKFQEKLSDLLHYPKLLENEQIKLAKACKEKEELESKLIVVCKELKNLKIKTQENNNEDYKPQLQRCQQELSQVKKNMEEIQRQRDMFCEQLKTTLEDLNSLRSESAKIIARTKERSELIKQQQQDQIDHLEKQLAQCRATACLSVNDRESVIKEMQGQLNTLSYSFDAAQKQIKTLKNHIAYMSNENSFPVKC